jgi:hypothetical protein
VIYQVSSETDYSLDGPLELVATDTKGPFCCNIACCAISCSDSSVRRIYLSKIQDRAYNCDEAREDSKT